MKVKSNTIILIFLLFIFLSALCIGKERNEKSFGEKETLNIAAASDMRFALSEAAEKFEEMEGIKIIITFSSSGNLANQIKNGAPYDIFISANKLYVDELSGEGVIENRSSFLQGFIAIAGRKNEVKIEDTESLRSEKIKRIAIANPAHAPFGFAAKEALENAGLWNELKDKIVFAESANQAMQYVLTGNAEAGIIPLSLCNEKLACIKVSDRLYSDIVLHLAIIKNSRKKQLANKFADYLKSEDASEIWRKHGYELL